MDLLSIVFVFAMKVVDHMPAALAAHPLCSVISKFFKRSGKDIKVYKKVILDAAEKVLEKDSNAFLIFRDKSDEIIEKLGRVNPASLSRGEYINTFREVLREEGVILSNNEVKETLMEIANNIPSIFRKEIGKDEKLFREIVLEELNDLKKQGLSQEDIEKIKVDIENFQNTFEEIKGEIEKWFERIEDKVENISKFLIAKGIKSIYEIDYSEPEPFRKRGLNFADVSKGLDVRRKQVGVHP